ncbi:helix-turn-helix domain-containing protein [Actinomadura kijaniata]|uniref:helix-turn-helix domain-containing protein n=1 Tax=Actinomadura kijaniata TaxID=46161 RepID=UPI00083378DC|nr:transcriptional regulator [Actinomadura kijaniata]
MDFAAALREALQGSGLTLERVRHRLAQRGLTVSVATLSYWQRGRSRPRSRTVVAALEEILQVPPGALVALLDDRAPEAAELWPDPVAYAGAVGELDRSGEHRLERISAHDLHLLGPDRRPRALRVREVLRATGDDVDRVVCVHPAGGDTTAARLTELRFCRAGRVRSGGGLVAFELVFDRVLGAGHTAVVEYTLTLPGDAPPAGHYERRFPRPVRDYLAVVQFDPGALPARCYAYSAETGIAARERISELWVGASGGAHLVMPDVRRGIVGLEWEWE